MARKKKVPGKDWCWNETDAGHEGVHTFESKLVWYTHMYNPHAVGGARTQTFKSFLEATANMRHPNDSISCQVRDYLLEFYPEHKNENDAIRWQRTEEMKTWKVFYPEE